MKKIIFSLILVLAFASFTACTKESANCEFVAAKIIRYDCDRVIFKLLTTESIGDSNWQDVQTGIQYENVVSYYNTCTIASLTNGNKDTLYLKVKKINENLYDSNCIQCQALSDNPPQTKVDITEITQTPCLERTGQ
ncbi:MAG: hypothetical protein ABIO04_03855 [Ferruginibacter sp.]